MLMPPSLKVKETEDTEKCDLPQQSNYGGRERRKSWLKVRTTEIKRMREADWEQGKQIQVGLDGKTQRERDDGVREGNRERK